MWKQLSVEGNRLKQAIADSSEEALSVGLTRFYNQRIILFDEGQRVREGRRETDLKGLTGEWCRTKELWHEDAECPEDGAFWKKGYPGTPCHSSRSSTSPMASFSILQTEEEATDNLIT